ncbi:hypothetical protein FOG18_02775 [Legionella israelensis]|uniref:hypothetical protein n=1 Tax=Legionella israelensis TaxID=454 RepID=UPI0011808B18|nr:hypothetical protein [Legionella israelensis]QDP71574.1 hypothetical protein FOG18_02775 [Legionella israelensis]
MHPILRFFLIVVAAILILFGIGLLAQIPWINSHWLWPDAPWLSGVFMTSAFYANAASYLYCGLFKRTASLRAASLSAIVAYGGCSMYLLLAAGQVSLNYDQNRLLMWGEICLIFVIINIVFYILARPAPFISLNPYPALLKWLMGLVVIANIWVSLRLIANLDAFAWILATEMNIIYGWILLGAATYTILVLLQPYWENIGGLFFAFIGYDLILLFPLVYLLFNPEIVPVHTYRLIAYILLVLLTLLTSLFYLRYVFSSQVQD